MFVFVGFTVIFFRFIIFVWASGADLAAPLHAHIHT